MSIEEFRRIKYKLIEYYELANKKGNVLETETLMQSFYDLQTSLLNQDLSNIPFEEWEGFILESDGTMDFSKTHANIDFSLIESFEYKNIILKGCNVKGIELIDYDKETFDEEFMEKHPEYFPNEEIYDRLINEFYTNQITFDDIIEEPLLRKCVRERSFTNAYDESYSFIKAVGYENAMKIFDENQDLVLFLTSTLENDFYNFDIDSSSSYHEIKIEIYKKIIDYVKNFNSDLLYEDFINIFPADMKEHFPNVFIMPGELPEEVKKRFENDELTIEDVKDYKDVLIHKIVELGNSAFYKITEFFGNFWKFFDEIPEDIQKEVATYIMELSIYQINNLENDLFEDLTNGIIIRTLRRSTLDEEFESICKYSKYIDINELNIEWQMKEFINMCGLDKLIEYNSLNNNILNLGIEENYTLFQIFVDYFDKNMVLTDINNLEELHFLLEKLIYKVRDNIKIKDNDWRHAFFKNRNDELSKVFNENFIDNKLLIDILPDTMDNSEKIKIIDDLLEGFNGNINKLLTTINKYPMLAPFLENKKIVFDCWDGNFYCKKNKRAIEEMYNKIGNLKFLEIISKYGFFLKEVDSITLNEIIIKLQNQYVDYESVINESIYNYIGIKGINFCRQYLPKSFQKQHPELFLKEDAPEVLKEKFYGEVNDRGVFKLMSSSDIQDNPNWIIHLMHTNLSMCINPFWTTSLNGSKRTDVNLYDCLFSIFPKEEVFDILVKYGRCFSKNNPSFHLDISGTITQIYENLLHQIYISILNQYADYSEETLPQEFKDKYPDLFIDQSAPSKLKSLFYKKELTADCIEEHPEWIDYIVDKVLILIFDGGYSSFIRTGREHGLTNREILEYFKKYGDYITACNIDVYDFNVETLDDYIQDEIIEYIYNLDIEYDEHAKFILYEKAPELFLDENAPFGLKDLFYSDFLSFEKIKENKNWIPYLKDKNIFPKLEYDIDILKKLIRLTNDYGVNETLKLCLKNPESVLEMLENDKPEILMIWYNKLNFIPHHTVMLEFPVDQIDKFVSSGKKWSKLCKIDGYNTEETKSALLKASMCFGVFDNDDEGFNKVFQLFTSIPSELNEEDMNILINKFSRLKDISTDPVHINTADQLLNYKIYTKKVNGKYELILDKQDKDSKKIMQLVKLYLVTINSKSILTPDKSHKLFGGFKMEYLPDFRDFILNNMNEILTSDEYISYISSMQKQWKNIKTLNSNRKLTLDLALAFVKSNSYEDVEAGNYELAEVSNKAGYSEEDFKTLQEIYNYGKIRTFNSIPRVKNNDDSYEYEMLRLDDPLAVAVGTLTDCCQEIGNVAEMCMQHSMVSKHGRIFVIKDKEENIVAQSWVWRNKNVICFDNIEIPDKAFTRAIKEGKTRAVFATEVYNLYKKAAEELIKKDNEAYDKLLKEQQITQKQYDSLKLAKVTVGIGFNDIKNAIEGNAIEDNGNILKPLDFEPLVELNRKLYTNDSDTQYILAGESNIIKSNEETLTLYEDEFKILDNENITDKDFMNIKLLEYATYDYNNLEGEEDTDIMESISYNYDFDSENTKIVKNANFVIIYEEKQNEIIIGDIFYNKMIKVDGANLDILDEIIVQITMALKQINPNNKKFNIDQLEDERLEIFNKAIESEEELYKVKGLSYKIKY